MFSSTLTDCAGARREPLCSDEGPERAKSYLQVNGGAMADDAPSPLDVLLKTMHLRWQEGKLDEAVGLAKAAAPYLHAKAVGGRGGAGLGALRDEELHELCARLCESGDGGAAAADECEGES
jgi:hypothetical protein